LLLLPALTWLLLGLWSSPYLLPVRLPFAGYLDITTLATGAWLPLALLAGYELARAGAWVLSLGDSYGRARKRLWGVAAAGTLALVVLLGGGANGLLLAPMIDDKPYIGPADAEA